MSHLTDASTGQHQGRGLRAAVVLATLLLAGNAAVVPSARAANGSQSETADFLYRIAREYRKEGRLADAIHELRKALIINPNHEGAKKALAELEGSDATRRQAIDDTLTGPVVEPSPAVESEQQPPLQEQAPFLEAPRAVAPHREEPRPFVRMPDPAVNGVGWFYVFGKGGDAEYGALAEPQRVAIQVPRSSGEPVSIRVLDADIRERHDEMDGDTWNTSTAFRVFGKGALDARTVGPQDADGLVLEFGPYTVEQGEAAGEYARFYVEAEGLDGDDNNLFAVAVRPEAAQGFSLNPAIRLSEGRGARIQFFPAVPEGSDRVIIEQNYDLDPEGGRITLIPLARTGRSVRSIPIAASGSGTWSKTEVAVPPGTDGTHWTYQITKATQRKANMSFRMGDEHGEPLPIYITRSKPARSQPTHHLRSRQPTAKIRTPAADLPRACNAFEFDASQSHDPDKSPLSYSWDFGDGTTAEGVRVRHTYTEAGTYRVALTVNDHTSTHCCTSEAEQMLAVNMPPKAALDAPAKMCAGNAVHLSGANSTDTPGETLRYVWDFGDGATADGADVDHVYARNGTFTVRLTVDDGRGTACSIDQTTASVQVNASPVVRTTETIHQCARGAAEPLEVTLSAAGSRDPDGDALTYSWDFGDGTRSTGEQASHVYQKGGQYIATVVADDGSGGECSRGVGLVQVHLNHPPVAVAPPTVAGCPDEALSFHANESSDADGNPLTYTWDFGDGTTADGAVAQHTYTRSGTFRTTVTVNDGSGMSCSTATAKVSAAINAPPVAQMKVRGEPGTVLPPATLPRPQ